MTLMLLLNFMAVISYSASLIQTHNILYVPEYLYRAYYENETRLYAMHKTL